ncbi:DegT/DnrJ/EryC1/StrS family aminotransferase [Candidatus Pelagibacter sp. HIMB1746]|uniref:DegT/DnrJ/EryC1/StrS family aminotransferase n=1 Tax=Candidatus Pelagibacter sp. HIMB1746 TaxID=3413370 RepID=UPI003F85B6D8
MNYPLLENAFTKHDLNEGVKVLKSRQLTMGKITKNFEKIFAKRIGSKYALMVNSGSSANLLMLSAIVNPLYKKKLKFNDEVLIPAICWSTSLWPIVQLGLKPVFVDVDVDTLNISIKDLKNKITKNTKAIMCVHVLGISSDMNEIKKICKKKNIIILEDTCESLGANFNKLSLGTIGEFGTYSFYYSHQITSGEGGMIVCNNLENYNILKSLRSHGWSRDTIFHKKYKKKYKNLNEKFLFINSGYNLRPTEVQAAIGLSQFKKLRYFKNIRNSNRNKIISYLKKSNKWDNQFQFVEINNKIEPSWFGFALLINKEFLKNKNYFLKFLDQKKIETRPILSGNFLNQPAAKLYNFNKNKKFPNADEIEKRGFFIGLHTKKINSKTLQYLCENLLKIEKN